MKKIFIWNLLFLAIFCVTPAMAGRHDDPFIHSVILDYGNVCNFTQSFALNSGDKVYFHTYLNIGDLITIKMKVSNKTTEPRKNDYWNFVNYNRRSFSRRYHRIFKTRLRIGSHPGSFILHYRHFSLPTGNIITFKITDNTYCHEQAKN